MRIMTDTNVILSSILSPGSECEQVLNNICENQELILCDYIINESYQVAQRKFPNKIYVLNKLFSRLRYELVPTPRIGTVPIQDVKDQPILNSALSNNIDILISGDKHFLNLNINNLKILSVAEYKKMYI